MSSKRPLIGCTTYRKRTASNPDVKLDGLMPVYTEAILAAGGLPLFIPLSLSETDLRDLFAHLDGILLPGGGDIDPLEYGGTDSEKCYGINKDRDFVELTLARWALAENKPVLGVCRGFQVLNIATGGTLWEDIGDQMPSAERHAYFSGYARTHLAHTVEICAASRLAKIMGAHQAKAVNSIHHQGVRELGVGWQPTAYATDGLVEAMEMVDHHFALAVQWHPEELQATDSEMLSLFQAFVAACQ